MIRLLKLLRSATSAAGNPENQRLARAHRNAMAAVTAQGVAILASLLTVPVATRYLGPASYGVFLVISSALVWLSIADFGLSGNAFVQALATVAARDSREAAQRTVSSVFFVLSGLAALLLCLFVLLEPFVVWNAIFNAPVEVPGAVLSSAMLTAVSLFFVLMPLGVGGGVLVAYQEAHWLHLWNMVGSLLGVLLLVLAIALDLGLPGVAGSLLVARGLGALGACLQAIRRRPWLMPVPRRVSAGEVVRLMPLSLKAIGAQLAGFTQFQTQVFIVSHYAGPSDVGVFSITHRLVTLPWLGVQLATAPLMPAIADAHARGEMRWAWAILRNYTAVAAAGSGLVCVGSLFWAAPAIGLWAGAAFLPSMGLVVVLAIYAWTVATLTPSSVFLYGVGQIGGQAVYAWANALVGIALMVPLTAAFGVVGTAAGMTLAFLLVMPAAQWSELRRFRAKPG